MASKRKSSSAGRARAASRRKQKPPAKRGGGRHTRKDAPIGKPSAIDTADANAPSEDLGWPGGETGEDEDLPDEGSIERPGGGPRKRR